ncbi:LysR substrate-binding domain-containing protein [Achromobacter ruhlandii]|uniref:LysR substrate-binding domain-containing protein n=1 Tax=Achromobacter ruhlandii TaxID=72557 RepID=UPI000C25F3CD|nr:LysR substrate-binding domain-containing protein [Achromobacter ruhlandii]MCV6798059.1 LysR substrate-binding domain-containing protein [Achromobacter ruhlandii]MCV6803261.1 LysR substrate-binding domain-containing protein [Achromobacter ruhlandii]MCV6810389.1 LysR substrate-binding domain-containing protein [Achromobacter ruhlandii]MCV6818478.1 LysR substrate-binding domain-containing protein [Achromobacter ruhlandii]PJM90525.1 LysR family transcriptional regulator [Achromobacter ruhlandii
MHFDLADLRLFIHIAESPSLTQAAKRAHLSLAAVSVRIKALENQLNTRLLYRDSRGVEITPAGQRLLQHARVIMRQVDHLKHDFQEQADGDAGHIRIFANTTAVTEFMPDILARFLAGHPGVTVDLQERLTRDIVRGVLDGTTDLGIVAGPVDAPELQTIHFSTDRLVLVVPNGHPLQEQDKVKLADAVRYPFITMHEGSTLVAFLRDQLERIGQRLPQRIQLYSFDSICRMVQAGVGVGVIPDSAARRYGAEMKLRVVELDEPWVVRERKLLVRDVDALPGCARELIEQIRQPAAA